MILCILCQFRQWLQQIRPTDTQPGRKRIHLKIPTAPQGPFSGKNIPSKNTHFTDKKPSSQQRKTTNPPRIVICKNVITFTLYKVFPILA